MNNEFIKAYKALWASVLLIAIRDARRYMRRKAKKTKASKKRLTDYDGIDAVEWIGSNRKTPGSFIWVCSVLEHDPEWVRFSIERARMAPPKVMAALDDFDKGEDHGQL